MPEEDEIRTELMGLLRYANATAVGKALGVSAQTVTNWARGRHPSQARLDQVRALYGLPVGSQGTTKESPPAWAEGLVNDAVAEVVTQIVTLLGGPEFPVALERLRERLEATPPLPHEAPRGEGGQRGPGTAARPEHTVG